jgi:N-acetylmuramoyl-L-alanine amidase
VVALTVCLFLSGGADLEDLARRHEIQWTCEAATGRHVLRAGATTMVFAPGLYTALVNNVPIVLSAPVALESGRVKLPPELARTLEGTPPRRSATSIVELSKTNDPKAKDPEPTKPRVGTPLAGTIIAIDAGHGGVHTGAKGQRGLLEKDINLGVAIHLQRILESWGARVVMTRTADQQFDAQVDEDLDARVQIVNNARPNLFLSIHTNYVANPGPRGFEVWVPRCAGARDRDSRDLAEQLRGELATVWGANEDRGTKDDHNLRVLKGTHCPAALVEMEFVSNPGVERQLGDPAKRREIALAIAQAVRNWVLRRP